MSLCAIIPASNLQAANAALASAGFGPNNFSVVSFTGAIATHAALHAWNDVAFATAVKALPGVAWEESEGNPVSRTKALIEAQGAQWGANAPPLTGNVTANTLYRHTDQSLWWVIQSYNATTYPDPTTIPALVRRARRPGVAEPWVQPIDQFDAYRLINPFTVQPDEAEHNGHVWIVSQGDGAGLNIWPRRDGEPIPDPEPEPDEWPEWVQPTGAHDAYQIGEQVTFQGGRYVCVIDANVWSPAAFPQGWEPRS